MKSERRLRRACPLALLALLMGAAGQSQNAPPGVPIGKGIVEGVVQNSLSGQPLEGARIKLGNYLNTELYTKTDAAGRFRFTGVNQGTYSIEAQYPGFLMPGQSGMSNGLRAQINLSPPRAANTAVTVTYGGQPAGTPEITTDNDGVLHASLTMALTPQSVITGKVTDANGLPMVDCQVQVLTRRLMRGGPTDFSVPIPMADGRTGLAPVVFTTTDDRGEFRAARLAPGSYYLFIGKPSGPESWERTYRETYYPNAIDPASAKPLDLTAGKEVRAEVQIVRIPGVRVAGHLIDPPVAPQSGPIPRTYTNLSLVAAGQRIGSYSGFTVANPDGSFEFLDVLPGKYTLQALTRERTMPSGPNQRQQELWAASRQVEISDNGEEGVTVEMQPLGELAGTVAFRQGCMPEPVQIHVQPSFSPVGFGPHQPPTVAPDGKFVLTGLAPVHYTIQMQSSGLSFPSSIQLGGIDVLRNGFDLPAAGHATLQIQMNCRPGGRPQ